MRYDRSILAAVASTCFAACGDGSSGMMLAEQRIGPGGGSVSAADGTTIMVPAGALSSEVAITISADASAPGPSGATRVGTAYVFGPDRLVFNTPVTVTLPFSPDLLPAEATAGDVQVFTAPLGSTTYTSLGGTPADADHVQAQTGHFSIFVAAVPDGTQDTPDATPVADGPAGADGPSSADAGAPDAGAPDAGAPDGSVADASGLPAPTVTSFTPLSGMTGGGTAIVITGTGFVATPTVTIGGTPATGVTWVNATTLNAIAPAHTQGVFDLVVTNPDGQAGTKSGFQFYGGSCFTPTSGEAMCGDGVDNDGDFRIDCADGDCNCCAACGCYPTA